jgi:hypothetical protein
LNIPFKIPVSLKNRTVVGAVCIAVALIVGFVLVPIVSNSASASVTVVRAKQDIPVGTLIKKDMLDTVSVGKKGLSDNVLHDVNDVVGKYAAVVITAEDNISASKLSSTGSMYNLNDGQLLISVAVKSLQTVFPEKFKPVTLYPYFILRRKIPFPELPARIKLMPLVLLNCSLLRLQPYRPQPAMILMKRQLKSRRLQATLMTCRQPSHSL